MANRRNAIKIIRPPPSKCTEIHQCRDAIIPSTFPSNNPCSTGERSIEIHPSKLWDPPLKLCRKPSITEDCNNGIMTIRLLSRFPLNWLKKEQEGDARKEPSTTRRRREKKKTSSVESSNDSSSSKSTLLSQELLGPIAPASQSNEESTLHSQELLAP